jgi:putative peptide zinc metalloprotease protein
VTVGAYLLTGIEALLLIVVIQNFEMVHQLLPVVRLDGYYIVADLTGVPDLFGRIRPILTSMLPGREPDERVVVLKRWVRVAVTAWVLVVVPLLAFELLLVLLHLPRILGTAWSSASTLWDGATKAFGDGQILNGASSILQVLILGIPILGILIMLQRLLREGVTWTWRHTEGRPVLRTLSGAVGTGCAVLLAMAWIPTHNYRPIGPNENGTMGQAVATLRHVPSTPGHLDEPVAPKNPTPFTTPSTTPPSTVVQPPTTIRSGAATTVAPVTTLGSRVGPSTTVAPSTTRAPRTTTTLGSTTTTR